MPPPPAAPVASYLASVERVTLDGSNTTGASFVLENVTTGGSVPAIISNETDSNIIIDLADASGDVWEIGDIIKITATKSGYSQATATHTIASGDLGMWDFGVISISTWSGSTVTEISTYQKELYEFYELYHEERTDIAAAGVSFSVVGKLAHADVLTATYSAKRTRVYINGVRATVTTVANNGADTDITVSETIVLGDEVDIFLACTTGTLSNNTTLGKIPLVELQVMQAWDATLNVAEQEVCGTDMVDETEYAADGRIELGILRRGNTNMKNFISAKENKKYLMIIVKDTTDPANTTYDVLHECRVDTYGRGTQAIDAKGGEIMDPVSLIFVPPVAVTT
jgi:hypothetical protein